MRWLVTGANGMLGTDARAVLDAADVEHTDHTRATLDLTDPAAVADAVRGHDVVLNCAAWTAVDDAEEHEAEAFGVNAALPSRLARAARQAGARLVHVSTDYVFAGDAQEPYPEDAQPAPRSAYGRTKAAGEWAVRAEHPESLVVRTAWLYGANGGCFPRTIARVARERGSVKVVDDQLGQPTWTSDVAALVLRLVEADVPGGIYHATSAGVTSWFGFAQRVVAAAGMDPAIVEPTTSAEFVRPAERPAYSVLADGAVRDAGVEPIAGWQDRWSAAASTVLGPIE